MASVGKMIEMISGMADTKDLNEWENEFVKSVFNRYEIAKKDTSGLTIKQCENVKKIYDKHFA